MTASYLDGLNVQQHTAVTAGDGPILVLAGPGSGKTRVLTHRIAYLIRDKNVPPWQILAVTFTNKAAREMRHRVEELLDGRLRGLTMGTFHAVCARILRQEADSLPYYDKDFVIFDTGDQQQVVKQALADLNLDDKKFPPNKLLNGISNAKNELITPEIYQATNYIAEVTRRVYAQYQQVLRTNNAMDFDDLLMNVVLLFDERPDVLQKYQQKYQHILVDEFQDTNTAQYAMLKRLAAGHGNILVVGDSDQSIYKWRGADYRNINRFRETYPDAQMILLEQNYRSTQLILDAAKAVIRQNTNRVDKELFTERAGGAALVLHEAYDEEDEAGYVVAQIENLMLNGYSPGDCAVMYRTNAQSRVLEEAFVRAQLPYRLVGATQFYKRREVKDVIAYLRLVHNPLDSVSFARVINTPPRGIGGKTQQRLRDWGMANGWQPAEALVRLTNDADVQHPFRSRAYNVLTTFGAMFQTWLAVREQVGVSELMDMILEQTEYRSYIENGSRDQYEAQDRWENVMELHAVAYENRDASLSDFLEQVALVSETDDMEENPNSVTLLTLHAAKGLEFPVVFLAGLEEGILPHSRSLEDSESMAEERRLFYVGLTRAMDRVYLTHAFRRMFWGETEIAAPSRFLRDIPVELVQGGTAAQRREATKSRASSWQWNAGGNGRSTAGSPGGKRPFAAPDEPRRTLPTPNHLKAGADDFADRPTPQEAKYRSGQRVRHTKFGDGTVIESKLTGNDEEVSVAFPEYGVKRLAASFANLQILSDR